jgi:hypothetical protein
MHCIVKKKREETTELTSVAEISFLKLDFFWNYGFEPNMKKSGFFHYCERFIERSLLGNPVEIYYL